MKSEIYIPPAKRNLISKSAETKAGVKDVESHHLSANIEQNGNSLEKTETKSETLEKSDTQTASTEGRFYIPPWRRNGGKSPLLDEKDLKALKEMKVDNTYTPPDWTELDHEFKDNISDEKLFSCCGVITDFPSSSDMLRENELKPYLKYGCEYRWIDRQTCLLVFLNEATFQRAISSTVSSLHRPMPLSHYCSKFTGSEILNDARELYSKIKPERDSKVANRLINHALGLRPARRPQSQPSSSSSKEKAHPMEETRTTNTGTTTSDAWDD